jgi:hypothetical protein
MIRVSSAQTAPCPHRIQALERFDDALMPRLLFRLLALLIEEEPWSWTDWPPSIQIYGQPRHDHLSRSFVGD